MTRSRAAKRASFFRGFAVCAVLALPTQAADAPSPGTAAINALLASEWEYTVAKDDLHGSMLTVDLPASWPPNGDGRLSYLAYVGGMRSGLADGEIIGSIWGRIVLDTKTAKASFERLSASAAEIGTQDVHPMSAKEIAVFANEEAAVRTLTAITKTKGAPKAADPVLRAFYCQWRAFDGVIADKLPSPEADFLRWLDCDKRVSLGAEADKKSAEEFAVKNARWSSHRINSWVEHDVPYEMKSRPLTPREIEENVEALKDAKDEGSVWLRKCYAKALPGDIWMILFRPRNSDQAVDVVVDLNRPGGLLETLEHEK
jgi:hypothetical protein